MHVPKISTPNLSHYQLLSKPKFSGVEKIKTIGSTYMAATGLNIPPGQDYAQVSFYYLMVSKAFL